MGRLDAFLKKHKPDVVAFQEVSPIAGTSALQTDLLDSVSNYKQFYVRCGTWEGREEGLMIMALDASLIGVEPLPKARNDMPRIAMIIHVPELRSIIVNTHLAFRLDQHAARQLQVMECLAAIDRSLDKLSAQVVLCGDLNEAPGLGVTAAIAKHRTVPLRDCWLEGKAASDGITFSSMNKWATDELVPGRRIDYIFVSEGLRVNECRLVLDASTPDCQPVSDHYGVMADLALLDL